MNFRNMNEDQIKEYLYSEREYSEYNIVKDAKKVSLIARIKLAILDIQASIAQNRVNSWIDYNNPYQAGQKEGMDFTAQRDYAVEVLATHMKKHPNSKLSQKVQGEVEKAYQKSEQRKRREEPKTSKTGNLEHLRVDNVPYSRRSLV